MSGTSSPKVGAPPPNSNQTLCRNILIHGYCKFADKGCAFRHSTEPSPPKSTLGGTTSEVTSGSGSNAALKKRMNVASPAFTPKSLVPQSASPTAATAASVAKSGTVAQSASPGPSQSPRSPAKRNITFNPQLQFNPDKSASLASQFASTGISSGGQSPADLPPSVAHTSLPPHHHLLSSGTGGSGAGSPLPSPAISHNTNVGPHHAPPPPPPPPPHHHHHNHHHPPPPPPPPPPMPDYGHYQPSAFPLQYHLYAPQLKPPRLASHEKSTHDLFLPNDIHEYLFRRNEAALQQMHVPGLPEQVHTYHSLVPLDTNIGHNFWTYKATSSVDGKLYCLRRLDNFTVVHEQAIQTVQLWKDIHHVNLVSVHEAFTTRAFGDHSLIFVYDYCPLAQTLSTVVSQQKSHPSLDRIWSYAVQILAALRIVHSHGRALRKIDAKSILVVGTNQLKIANAAMMDVLRFDDSHTDEKDDLVQVGELLNEIATGPKFASATFTKFTSGLIDGSMDLDAAIKYTAPYALDVYSAALTKGNEMEWHLQRELENSRLVRLLCKLGFINERPEYSRDPRWSDTGDRYIIKLFRDYVFHQVDDQGHPIVDLAHVLTCLNKLDAGIKENLLLVSRDEQNCLIVSYNEIRQCIDSSFRELLREAV